MRYMPITLIRLALIFSLAVLFVFDFRNIDSAATDMSIYGDSLSTGWQDWSWNVTDDLSNPAPVHSDTKSIAVTFIQNWDGFQLGRLDPLDLSGVSALRFWIHGGASGNQTIQVALKDGSITDLIPPQTVHATAQTWVMVEIPITNQATSGLLKTIQFFNNSPNPQSVFYLDDISLVSAAPIQLTLTIDPSAQRKPINPLIYGMNFASESLASELKLPINRWGGNATTRYNWQNDTSNHAMDWYFENIPNDNPHPELLPDGSSADQFIEQNSRTGSQTLLTVPLIGYTPKSREILCGFSVKKYGSQTKVDPYRPDCGNGIQNGAKLTGNPADTSIPITPQFVKDWIVYLQSRYGTAAQNGVRFYNLDNEPMLWNDTHRDVHPQATSYDEVKQLTIAYASAIKTADPNAQTLGPVLWGWPAYFYSALDISSGGATWWDTRPDRKAHGDVPFLPWYLQQMKTYQDANGVRLLDYVDIHYYPQGTNVFSDAVDPTTSALRLRMTRSLWDPTYTDESWINDKVNLIPRLREWVSQYYPGTKTAISEYSFGALGSLNGAIAQADALGIFGREQLDLATLWTPPTTDQPGAFAFRLYRNYDGKGSQFGDTSISALSSNSNQLAVFAGQRSYDGALTVMIINKSLNDLNASVQINNFSGMGLAEVYQYSSAKLDSIQHLSPHMINTNSESVLFPGSSITLWVLPPSLPNKLYFPAIVY